MANPSRNIASQAQKQMVKDQVPQIKLENPNISFKQSLEFMKKLTLVATSSILFLRGVFPEDAFSIKEFGGQKVYILNSSMDDVTKVMSVWLLKAFDLVNSQHLKKLILLISQGDVTLETYSFSFMYNDDTISCASEIDGKEVQLSQGLPKDISKSVVQLIRSVLVITTTLKPLPDDYDISLRLLVDKGTPPEAVPSVFQLSPSDSKLHFPEKTSPLKLGKIETNFTTLTVSTKHVVFPSNNSDKEETLMSQAEEDVSNSQVEPVGWSASVQKISQFANDIKEPDNSELTKTFSAISKTSEHDTQLTEEISLVSLREKKIACICGCVDLLDDTIRCMCCNTFQHKICYMLLESQKVKTHICVMCHNPNQEMICSVPELVNDVNRKESALYRQALVYCCKNPRISCNRIMTYLKVPRRVAEKIFQQLEDEECFHLAANKGNIRYVKEGLKESISHHFRAPICSHGAPMDTQFLALSPQSSNLSVGAKRNYDEDTDFLTLSPQSSNLSVGAKRNYDEDTQFLPLSPQSPKVSVGAKRNYDEAKENCSPMSASCSEPTQPKMLKTSTNAAFSHLY